MFCTEPSKTSIWPKSSVVLFLSPPVHFAQWAHMHHLLSVCLSVCLSSVRTGPKFRLDNNSYLGKYYSILDLCKWSTLYLRCNWSQMEAHFKYEKGAKQGHTSWSVIEAKRKPTVSVALQLHLLTTWASITCKRIHDCVKYIQRMWCQFYVYLPMNKSKHH